MATQSTKVLPYFRIRLMAALLSLVGFWFCLAQDAGSMGGKTEREVLLFKQSANRAEAGKTNAIAVGVTAVERARERGLGIAGKPAVATEPAVVLIDPGHGGADGGMVRNGLIEKDWTLRVGIALAEELKGRGHMVELTRETDATLPLEQRPVLANAVPRVALLSIHFNAGTPDASGVETWYSWPKKPEVMARLHDAQGVPILGVMPDDGQRLALAVQQAVTGRTGARDRGIKNREDLAMTSRTVCPAILIECGFLSNGVESRKIQEVSYRKKLVLGIADGYEAWLKSRPLETLGTVIPVMTPKEEKGPLPGVLEAVAGDAEH